MYVESLIEDADEFTKGSTVTLHGQSCVEYSRSMSFGCFIGFVISSVLWIIPILGWILAPILYIVFVAFSVMGIINAVNGHTKALPIVGKLKVFK